MKRNKKHFLLLLFIFMVFALGFLRDAVFIKINIQLGNLKGTGVLEEPFAADLFTNHLYILKWLLTILFSSAYLVLACLIIYLLYNNKRFIRYTILFHLSFELISFMAIIIGRLYDYDMMGYRLARDLMGITQSPILLMILIPAFSLIKPGVTKVSED